MSGLRRGPIGEMTFTQAGTGASERSAQDKLREIVTPEDFGAAGDGTTDDAEALQAFFDFVLNGVGTSLRGHSSGKNYRIASGLVLTGNRGVIDFTGSVITPDASVLEAVTLGSSAVLFENIEVVRLLVQRASFSDATENVGILYKNVAGCSLYGLESRLSKYNHVLRPDTGERVAYNDFYKIAAYAGVYNLWFDQQGTGFANENNFFGGRLVTTSDTVNNVHAPTFNQANTNRLYGVCVEGDGERAIYCNSQYWTIDNCRTEGTWTVGAIHLGTGSQHCRVVHPRVDEAVLDEGLGNRVDSGLGSKQSQGINGAIVQRFLRYGAATVTTAITGSPTASTTANSQAVTVSAIGDIAVGDYLNIAGGVNMGRVEYIDGTDITLDTLASATVAGAAITRVLPPALDVSDEYPNSGTSYAQRLYTGRTGASSYLTRGYARDTEVYFLDATGQGYFAQGVKLGSGGAQLKSHLSATASLAFGSIAAGSSAELTVTVTGATTAGGIASASPQSSLVAGLSWCARVSGADTVSVRVVNSTSGAITPATVTWRVVVWQH